MKQDYNMSIEDNKHYYVDQKYDLLFLPNYSEAINNG